VTADAPILETQRLTRHVTSKGAGKDTVRDFSYSFLAGRIYSILGPSGAGKSSVLRLLNRLDEPTSGEVFFEGSDYRTIPPCALRKRIGCLFQVPYLFPGSVTDNVRYANPELESNQMAELLRLASFDPDRQDQATETLSVGEKQRVALARLLATDPKVVLLDEPTAALDPTHTARIESSVREIASQKHLCVIMVSHSPEQALRMGGNGLLLVSGRLEEYGSVDDLINHPQTEVGLRYRNRELL
jgi:putative ABC transport system ATP-binding protein